MAQALVTISGNATGDPDLKFIGQGSAVAEFTVASTPRVFKNDVWVDGEPTFLKVKAWRKLGEHAADVVKKGTPVVVTGKLAQWSFEKDGQKRTGYELVAEDIGVSVRALADQKKPSVDPWGSKEEAPF